MNAALERSRFAVGDIQPRLLQAGPREAREAAVFVHGNPGSADDWETLIRAAADRGLRALALDLPDFGETGAPPGFDHSPAGYAAFLAEALESLGIERVHLVVHDFGGPIGLMWAATHPEELASVALIGTGILPGYRWHRIARIWRTPGLGELLQMAATRRSFRWVVNLSEPRKLPRTFLDRMYRQYDRRTRRAVLKLYRATPDPGSAGAEFAALMRPRDVPALVVWGECDAYLPSTFAERQRDAFPSAEIHVLPASGHWPFIDTPGTVERLLIDFLSRAAAQPSAGR